MKEHQTIDLEPTQEDLDNAFHNRIRVEEKNGNTDTAGALHTVHQLWITEKICKKDAYNCLELGIITDTLKEELAKLDR